MSVVKHQIWRLAYRARFYLDVPSLIQLLKFRQLRAKYFRNMWVEAARNIGAEYKDWSFGYGRISRNGLTTFVKHSKVMLDNQLTLDIMGNKALVYELLEDKGYPVARHNCYTLDSLSVCEEFYRSQNGPVVVKPASGTGGGRGVTTGITSIKALRTASRYAARFDGTLLVEEQLNGNSYRLLYLDGKFIDAVRRDPPEISGNGMNSIRKLVSLENQKRLVGDPVTALSPLKIDHDCQNRLSELKLRPGYKPKEGERVELKRAINENSLEKNYTVRNEVHPETIATGADLVRDLGIKFAGLDVICDDISKPLSESNGVIGEINTTPGLHHHYLIKDKSAVVRVAELVLDHMFAEQQGVMRLDPHTAPLIPTLRHNPPIKKSESVAA